MLGLFDRITIDPALCPEEPTIRGLRHPVESLLELRGAGMTLEAILADDSTWSGRTVRR